MNRKQRRAEGKGSKSATGGLNRSGPIEQTIFGQALGFHQAGRLREAEAGYREVLSLNSRHAGALCYLGLLAHQSGQSDAAIELLKKAIVSDKSNPELHYNLACVLSDCGRDDEAILQNQKAIDLKPDYPDALNNLGALLLLHGHPDEALAKVVQGLKVDATKNLKSTFAMIVQSLEPSKVRSNPNFVGFLARALTDPWCRPRDISGIAIDILFRDAAFDRCRQRMSQASPAGLDDLFSAENLASLTQNALLHAVLSTAPVTTVDAECILSAMRHALLIELEASSAHPADRKLSLACGLAQQCFINEYVFDVSDLESDRISALRQSVEARLGRDERVEPLEIAVLATYLPLHTIAGAERIAKIDWPESLLSIATQQIEEVRAELAIRPGIETMTAIDNEVSEKVREQYEENPYPRWTRIASDIQAIPLDRYIGSRFPHAPYKSAGKDLREVLIAGCGTGMHAIQRAQQFASANVLAIDLSLSSLSYAIRKTRELGLTNIHYAQADILALDSNRTFDLIDSSGVLHHLETPLDGWRKLVSLLRPGGLMHIGLYSKLARADINVARAQLEKDNQSGSASEIRRLRKAIIDLPDTRPLHRITRFSDFFSMSECRDLLFHVQEHQFSIPEIASFLAENNLTFIGFETLARKSYLAKFPGDPAGVDLDNWNCFETDHPQTFTGMYQFWIQKQ